MNLCRYENELDIIFEEPFIDGELLLEFQKELKAELSAHGIPQSNIASIIKNMKGVKGYERVGLDWDRRFRHNRPKYRILTSLNEITNMCDEAEQLGLDTEVRDAWVSALGGGERGIQRYNDIMQYGSEEKVKTAIEREAQAGKFGDPPDNKAKKARQEELHRSGLLSPDEITVLWMTLTDTVKPLIESRYKELKRLRRRDPGINRILGSTDVSRDITINYEDMVSGAASGSPGVPVRRSFELTKDDPLSVRIRKFGTALNQVEPELKKEVYQKFVDTYRHLVRSLDNDSILPGPENESQRIYTATLYALYNVAHEIDINYREEKAKQQETEAKTKAEEEKKQAEEAKKKQEAEQAEKAKVNPNDPAITKIIGDIGLKVKPSAALTPEWQQKAIAIRARMGDTHSLDRVALALLEKVGEQVLQPEYRQGGPSAGLLDRGKKRSAEKAKKAADKAKKIQKEKKEKGGEGTTPLENTPKQENQ